MSNFEVTPNHDGTVDILHYGTRFSNWWVGEITQRRGYVSAQVYGKTGGNAEIRLTKDEALLLGRSKVKAQQLARTTEAQTLAQSAALGTLPIPCSTTYPKWRFS